MVKKYLTSKKVEFTSVDVTNDTEKRKELEEKTGRSGVPVTTDGEEFIHGFHPNLLAKLVS
jgi:glutaredoxin